MTTATATTPILPLEEAIARRLEALRQERQRQEAERAQAIERQDNMREAIRQWVSAQVARREGVQVDPVRWDVMPCSLDSESTQEFEVGLWEQASNGVMVPVTLEGYVLASDSASVGREEEEWVWRVNFDDEYEQFFGLVDAVLCARGVEVVSL